MRPWLFLLMALPITGCTTRHAGLEAFVGEGIQQVIPEYGQPHVAFDMGDDMRDFQWVMSSSEKPVYSVSSGALIEPEQQLEQASMKRSVFPMFNAEPVLPDCLYTIKAYWDDNAGSWIVTGYHKPTSGC